MSIFYKIFYSIIEVTSLNQITLLLNKSTFAYIIAIALFCCVLLLMSVFSKFKIVGIRLLFAWLMSCVITLIYLANGNMEQDKLSDAINSQIILSFASFTIMLIFYLLGLIGTKPNKPRKNFGRNTWWIRIISFVVLLAFCCVFNISLFVSSALFYL